MASAPKVPLDTLFLFCCWHNNTSLCQAADLSLKQTGSNTDIVCVDGSEGADRAMRYALANTPKDHTLVLLHGAQVPRTLPERLFNYQVHRFAEGK